MARHGKNFTAAEAQVEDRSYTIDEAIPLIQKVKYAKFDETVELAIRLGVDPRHADQMVRGTVVLPHGLGKSKRVLVIAGADKQKEATEAGAEYVGGDELVEKVFGGWVDFDAVEVGPQHNLVAPRVQERCVCSAEFGPEVVSPQLGCSKANRSFEDALKGVIVTHQDPGSY